MHLRTPRHRHIMAAAGTGKTFQLTGEYIHRAFLESESPAAENASGLAGILATTFTRKAAGEILDRVLERLAKACTGDKELKSLQPQVADDLSQTDCRRLLARLLSELDRLSIQTLDAFFLRAATGLALDAGLPPGWTIADEDVDAKLREEAMWNVTVAELRDGRGDALLDLMSLLGGGRLKSSILRPFATALKSAYSAYVDAGCDARPWGAVDVTEIDDPDEQTLSRSIFALGSASLPAAAHGKPHGHWARARDSLLDKIREGDLDRLLKDGLLSKIIANPDRPATHYGLTFPDDFLQACLPIARHVKGRVVKSLKARNLATRILLDRFHAAYQDLKRATGRYAFDDLPRLLTSGTKGINRDAMYFMIDTRLRHVLLDEFQDTSRVQYALLEPILSELFASSPDGDARRSVFCVGDVKQSIYAWRNAEPALMPAVRDRWPAFHKETMQESRRSSPAVIGAVNAVFAGLGSNLAFGQRANAAASWCRHFEPHTAHQATLAGRVQLRTCGLDEDGKPDPLPVAAQIVRDLVADQPLATVGVLLRSRKPIGRILHHLRRLGIEASEESGTSLLDTPATSATISALHLADLPGDKAAAFHVAAGPIGSLLGLAIGTDGVVNFADSLRVASSMRARFASGGVAGVVGWIRAGCERSLNGAESLRMEQLLDLAEAFDGRGEGGLSDFVRLARQERVEDPSMARVRVMTIHASKGLEFDAVVLPELDKDWADPKGLIVTRRADVFSTPNLLSLPGNESLRACHEELAAAHATSLERKIEEEISCLYVAMTRARRALDIVVEPSEKEPSGLSAASVLRHALEPRPAGECELLWSNLHGHAWHANFEASPPPPEADMVEVSLRASRGSSSPRARTASPSSLAGGETAASDIFSTRGERSADEGTLLHAWAEAVEWHSGDRLDEAALLATAAAQGFDTTRAGELLDAFRRSLASDVGHALSRQFNAARERTDEVDLRREWAFRTQIDHPDGDGRVELTGRIDRLVIGRRGGKAAWADVLDFKSDAVSPAECEDRARGHAPQMKAYARAVARMFSLPPEAVGCHVVFLRPGRVVTLPGPA